MIKKFVCLTLVFLLLSALLVIIIPSSTLAQDEELLLTILHTNDEHSALVPSPLIDYHPDLDNPSLGGFARLASVIKDIRSTKAQQSEPVLLLSAGDYVGGSPYSWLILDGKAPELSLMIELGYDVVTIGNHEYDYGPDVLARYLKAAGYPSAQATTAIVASNTVPPQGHPLGDMGIKNTHIMTLENGLKVGFFGLIGVDAVSVAPSSEPMVFSEQIEAAQKAVTELKKAGVDIIIGVNHTSVEEDEDLVAAVGGIDIIVTGHCHTALQEPVIVGETIIVSSGELLKNLGKLELAYNPTTQKVRIRNDGSFLIPLNHSVGEDPEMLIKVQEYTTDLNEYITQMTHGKFTAIDQTVVYSGFELPNKPELQESPFGNFITDAMRLVAQEATGDRVDFAFQANGVIRGAMVPGTMPYSQRKISFFDLAGLVGLGTGPDNKPGYPMVSVYLTGEEVRRVLEVAALLPELMDDTYFLQVSGLRMEYSPNRAVIATIPFIDLPIPSTRAVLSAEKYVGEGIQDHDNFQPLKRGDETLYHIVTDYYIAAFLPMAGEMLPSLELILKDKYGNPIEVDESIIYRDGEELKVWQAVLEYAADQHKDSQGNATIPDYYATTDGRLIQKRTIPLLVWLMLIFVGIITVIVLLVKRRKRKKRLFY